jgi:hypothetical protein
MSKIKYINLEPFPEANFTSDINTKDHNYDLHTLADFVLTTYNVEKRKASIVWKYPGRWGISNDNPFKDNTEYKKNNDIESVQRYIALNFNNVIKYAVKPRDPEMPFSEDDCLSQILTYDSEDNYNEDVLVFEFQSGLEIKIEAEEISFDRDFKFP